MVTSWLRYSAYFENESFIEEDEGVSVEIDLGFLAGIVVESAATEMKWNEDYYVLIIKVN